MNITEIFNLGEALINRVWPDPQKRAEEIRKLEEIKQKGDANELNAHVQLMLGQLKINEQEAKSGSLFVAGWRPWIGWVGGIAIAYQFVLYPILLWIWAFAGLEGEAPPVLDTGALFAMVTGLLGIGTMRSYDKGKGTDTKKIN